MTTEQYAEFLRKQRPVVMIGGVPWQVAHRRLLPVPPPHRMKPVDPALVRKAMKQTATMIAQWNDAWDTEPCRWWWICCDSKDYDIANFPKNPRRDIRKGLEACEVRLMAPEFFAEHGYPVFASAHDRYSVPVPLSAEEFRAGTLRNAEYPGRQTWGAFIDDKLVAYESCIIVDDAAISASAKADPAYLKARPNNALVYTLTRHYLVERGLSYTTAGQRVLHHKTSVQDFQLRMGYRQVYCPLRTVFSPLLWAAIRAKVCRWGPYLGLGKLLGGAMSHLEAAAKAYDITRRPSLDYEPSAKPQSE